MRKAYSIDLFTDAVLQSNLKLHHLLQYGVPDGQFAQVGKLPLPTVFRNAVAPKSKIISQLLVVMLIDFVEYRVHNYS